MDSDPLVPREASPTRKYIVMGVAAALGLYMFIVFIIAMVNAHKYSFTGSYLVAISMILLLLATFALFAFMPREAMDAKAKHSVHFLIIALALLATGVLLSSFQKTPCPKCPPCPPPSKCTLVGVPTGQWSQNPYCFDDEHKTDWIAISPDKKCPPS